MNNVRSADTGSVEDVTVTADPLQVELSALSTIPVPLAWYPLLVHATQAERDNWEMIGVSQSIRWPNLDEDLSRRIADCMVRSFWGELRLVQAVACRQARMAKACCNTTCRVQREQVSERSFEYCAQD